MSELWVPESAKPRFLCELCGAMFYRGEEDAYGRHMKKCSDANEDLVMERSTSYQLRELMAVGDFERDDWVKKNRQAIIEGRKLM